MWNRLHPYRIQQCTSRSFKKGLGFKQQLLFPTSFVRLISLQKTNSHFFKFKQSLTISSQTSPSISLNTFDFFCQFESQIFHQVNGQLFLVNGFRILLNYLLFLLLLKPLILSQKMLNRLTCSPLYP
jgi:hypothetical protein